MKAPLRVLFVVEGHSDIRFVSGLSEICQLSMLVPGREFAQSGLKQRIADARLPVKIDELAGGRLAYQLRSIRYLLRHARRYDVILTQELLRGTLSCTVSGRIRGVPVVAFMAIPPVEYFRCRRLRNQQGPLQAAAGEALIRALMFVNGKLVKCCVALGPYLMDVASRSCSHTVPGYYYGVDTDLYHPADPAEVGALRDRLGLPRDKFLVFMASRISHEKDPETVLQAVAMARSRGLDAAVLNLGGSFRDFLDLAATLKADHASDWVLGRPAAHPMGELASYYRASDCLAQASLEEGAGMAPLEALACGVPAVCTAVGGLGRILPGHARLTPRRDPRAMADQFLWIASNREQARREALAGREFVMRQWGRPFAFDQLRRVLESEAAPT